MLRSITPVRQLELQLLTQTGTRVEDKTLVQARNLPGTCSSPNGSEPGDRLMIDAVKVTIARL